MFASKEWVMDLFKKVKDKIIPKKLKFAVNDNNKYGYIDDNGTFRPFGMPDIITECNCLFIASADDTSTTWTIPAETDFILACSVYSNSTRWDDYWNVASTNSAYQPASIFQCLTEVGQQKVIPYTFLISGSGSTEKCTTAVDQTITWESATKVVLNRASNAGLTYIYCFKQA